MIKAISHSSFVIIDGKSALHISCSTVSPTIARKLQGVHQSHHMEFVSSPVFARPDGISRREATFMLSGKAENKAIAQKYLALLGRTEDIGEEIGAANVVKLCGNFLIAVRITYLLSNDNSFIHSDLLYYRLALNLLRRLWH